MRDGQKERRLVAEQVEEVEEEEKEERKRRVRALGVVLEGK